MNFGISAVSKLARFTRSLTEERGWTTYGTEDSLGVGEIYGKSYKEAIRAYKEVSPLAASINYVARAISQVPIRLYEMERDETGDLSIPVSVANHEILDLIRDVNPFTSNYNKLIYQTVVDRYLAGISYWQIVRDGRFGEPVELFRRRPDWIIPDPDAEIMVSSYYYYPGGMEYEVGIDLADSGFRIAPENMIVHQQPNPEDDLLGLSTHEQTKNYSSAETRSLEYNLEFFGNNARPDGLLSTEQELSRPDTLAIKREWMKTFKGRGKSHRTAVLPFGMKYETMATSQRDAEYVNFRKMVREDICSQVGVFPQLLGYGTEEITEGSLQIMRRQVYEFTLRPIMESISDVLNWSLLPNYRDLRDNAFLAFDTSEIPGMNENEKERWERWTAAVFQGIAVPNEARAALGIKGQLPWGDTWMMPRRYRSVEAALEEEENGGESAQDALGDASINSEEGN